jgi:recombinational DNA repair ATPase RecF
LLDDIDSELDQKRIAQLLEYMDGKTQNFATTSKRDLAAQMGKNTRIFSVEGGEAKLL